MGRKINPIGFRLGIVKDWESKWFAEGKEYSKLLVSDIAIRKLIRDRLGRAGISRIEIQRFPKRLRVTIVTAKPGVVIGRRGANVNALKQELEALTGIEGKNLRLDVTEVRNVDTDAALVAESIAEQLEQSSGRKPTPEEIAGLARAQA